MITLFTGTPGSGKSFHMAKEIVRYLRTKKKGVISTVDININHKIISNKGRRRIGRFTYIPQQELKPQFLKEYALKYHKPGKENQTLLVIDECQLIFNTRDYRDKDRIPWIEFLSTHRQFYYNVILVTQNDMMLDKQIRALIEYDVKHRKLNNFGILWMMPITTFAAIKYWYQMKILIDKEVIFYNRRYSSIYNSFMMFEEYKQKAAAQASNPSCNMHPSIGIQDAKSQSAIDIQSIQSTYGAPPAPNPSPPQPINPLPLTEADDARRPAEGKASGFMGVSLFSILKSSAIKH